MNTSFTLKNILLVLLAIIFITLAFFVYMAEKNYPTNPPSAVKDINAAKPKLIKEDIVVGTGDELKPGQEGVFNYVGTLEDGTEFDASAKSGGPFTARIGSGEVIAGWDQGLPGMKIGGKRKLFIPYGLAYGEKANGKIPAKANLRFEVELLKINP
jgi:FKBP-type peptidyl-prolyl cis-trans isomerase